MTVTAPGEGDAAKQAHVFHQAHAHEPAATAGMVDFLSQLLDGQHLDGRAGELDRERILHGTVLTFIPDGNPDGRARAPVDFWDGSHCNNEEFLKIAFGRTPDGQRCQRLGRWSLSDRRPARIGIVYEQISDDQFVESNRDTASTFFRLLRRSIERHPPAQSLGLHQTEFEGSEHNAMVLLPFLQDELPDPIRGYNLRWAAAIIDAWRAAGANPMPQPRPLGYGEDQIQYFRRCWSDLYRSAACLTTEVQNNSPRTPVPQQIELCAVAIRTGIEFGLSQADTPDAGSAS